MLAKAGRSVSVYATPATVEMAGLIVRDAARIQVGDVGRQKRKRQRAGEPPLGKQKRVVFSGDLGPRSAPILEECEPFLQADLVFMESTYTDHGHRSFDETVEGFVRTIGDTAARCGKILVPTFAVGRAQLLTGPLAWMFRKKMVPPFPSFWTV